MGGKVRNTLKTLPPFFFLIIILIFFFNNIGYSFKPEVLKVLVKNYKKEHLIFPIGVKVNPKNYLFYVIEGGRNEITVYDLNFLPIFFLGKGRGVDNPVAMDIDSNGTIYVLQQAYYGKPDRISIFDSIGILEKEIYLNSPQYQGIHPSSLCVLGNKIYLVGRTFPGILVLDKKTGKVLKKITIKDEVQGFPIQVSFSDVYKDTNKRLYFLSEDAGRFYVYDKDGNFLFKGGKKGGRYGQLSRPKGIAASPSLSIIVVIDYMRHTGLVYDYNTGKFLGEFGGEGWSPGWFAGPRDVDIDAQGRIYVVDSFNRRVQVLILTAGKTKGVWSPTFVTPLQPVK